MKDEVLEQMKQLHKKVEQLLDIPYTVNQIIEELGKDGINEHYARTLIENVRTIAENKEKAQKFLLIGIISIASGASLTIISSGSFIFYGLVGAGILSLIRWRIIRQR